MQDALAAKRRTRANVIRFAVAQAFGSANSVIVYATAAIVGDMLAPSKALATLPISVFVVGMASCTLPMGAIARRFLGDGFAFMRNCARTAMPHQTDRVMMMKHSRIVFGFSALLAATSVAWAAGSPLKPESANQATQPDALSSAAPDQGVLFHPESVDSEGSVTVEGARIDYRAVAGTIIVHPKDWDDAAWREHPGKLGGEESEDKQDKDKKNEQDLGDRNPTSAEASIFYVAYFKKGLPSKDRPITFLFNGGPGSS